MLESFQKAEKSLGNTLILTWLELRETLYIYLAIMDKVVSLVLIKEEGDKQKPIYFSS